MRDVIIIICRKNEGIDRRSTCGKITHAAGRLAFMRSAVRKGRAIFLHQKARGRRYSSAYIRLIRRSASLRLPPFFMLLISRIRLYARRGKRGGRKPGQSISSGDRNRVRDYSTFFTMNPQYADKSVYRKKKNERIPKIYPSSETYSFLRVI